MSVCRSLSHCHSLTVRRWHRIAWHSLCHSTAAYIRSIACRIVKACRIVNSHLHVAQGRLPTHRATCIQDRKWNTRAKAKGTREPTLFKWPDLFVQHVFVDLENVSVINWAQAYFIANFWVGTGPHEHFNDLMPEVHRSNEERCRCMMQWRSCQHRYYHTC